MMNMSFNKEHYEEAIKKLNDEITELKNEKDRYFRMWRDDKDCLKIGSVSIPLSDEMKKRISDYIDVEIRRILSGKEDLTKYFIDSAMNYKKAFINLFTPIVKEIVESLDFNVSFESKDKE